MPDGDKPYEEVWQDICEQLKAANVPLQQVDAYAIELCARAVINMRKAERLTESEDEKLALKAVNTTALIARDLMRYLQAICATPGARVRTIKPEPPPKTNAALSAIDDILNG
jgi:hypothetical protein